MTGFTLQPVHADFYSVMHGGRRVAILTPARAATTWPPQPALPWSIIIDPAAFPDLPAHDLPWPLRNCGMNFGSFEEVKRFLGVQVTERAA